MALDSRNKGISKTVFNYGPWFLFLAADKLFCDCLCYSPAVFQEGGGEKAHCKNLLVGFPNQRQQWVVHSYYKPKSKSKSSSVKSEYMNGPRMITKEKKSTVLQRKILKQMLTFLFLKLQLFGIAPAKGKNQQWAAAPHACRQSDLTLYD